MIINEHFHLGMFLRDWTQSSILDILIFLSNLAEHAKENALLLKFTSISFQFLRSFDYIMSK